MLTDNNKYISSNLNTSNLNKVKINKFCSNTYISLQFDWMRKHQAVDAGYGGDQDDDEAMGLVDTDAIQNGRILEAESHTVAVQIEVQ